MPKGRHIKNNLTRVREGIGLSQLEFARRLGVSVSIIKKVEAGERPASSDLAARVFAETGVLLTSRSEEAPIEYTKANTRPGSGGSVWINNRSGKRGGSSCGTSNW